MRIKFSVGVVLALLLFVAPGQSWAVDVAVTRVNASQFMKVGASAPFSAMVPAQASATALTSGGGASRWVALAINSTAAGKLMQAALWAAGIYMAGETVDRLMKDYWAGKGYMNNNGVFGMGWAGVVPTSGNCPALTPGGASIPGGESSGGYYHHYMAYLSSYNDAYYACDAFRLSGTFGNYSGCVMASTVPVGGAALVGWKRMSYTGYAGGYSRMAHFFYPDGGTYTSGGVPYFQAQTASQAQTTAQNDINSGNAAAFQALQDSLNLIGTALENNTHALNRATTEMGLIKTTLNNALTQAQKDSVSGSSGGDADTWADANKTNEVTVKNMLTAAEVQQAMINALQAKGLSQAEIEAAMSGALQANSSLFSGGTPLTAAQIQSAMEAALTTKGLSYDGIINAMNQVLGSPDSYNPTAVQAESLPSAPEKKSLPGVLGTFWENFSNLPVISLLNTFQVTASGSSTLSLNLPGLLGGSAQTVTIDFAQWQDIFSLMGNILLTIVGIRWTIYLFEG